MSIGIWADAHCSRLSGSWGIHCGKGEKMLLYRAWEKAFSFHSQEIRYPLFPSVEEVGMGHKRRYHLSASFYAVLFTLVIALFLTWKIGLYPFGDHYFRYLDADQYYGFYGYLQNSFFSKSNLLYSWGIGLGDGMLSTYGYYASSPFNLLLVFFRNDLILGMQVITLLKVLFISLSFCLLLDSFDRDHAMEKGLFSTAYAYTGYVVFYAWNLSWLDGAGLLPLVILGLKKLLYEKKKALYIIAIGLAILANFYTGYMICLASGICYAAYCLYIDSAEPFSFRRLFTTFGTYLVSSLWGVALSVVLFVPTIMALPENRKQSLVQMLRSMKINFSAADFVSTFYTASVLPRDSADNLPVTFIGIIPFLLLFAYFLNRKIRLREKVLSLLLTAVFVCSFAVSFFTIVWHGFSVNFWFNYRYSFIFSFLLLLIAYRSLTALSRNWRILVVSEILFLLLTFLVFGIDRSNRLHFDAKIFYCDIALSLAGALLLIFYCTKKALPKTAATAGLVLLVLLNSGSNAFILLQSPLQKTSVQAYFSRLHTYEAVKQNLPDRTVARIGNDNTWGRCEACQFDYAGTAVYASTIDMEKLKAARRLGLAYRALWCEYTLQAPRSTDNLLGYHYLLSDNEFYGKKFRSLGKQGDQYVYKNNDALPLIFSVDHLIDACEDLNDFEYQNKFFESFLPEDTVQGKIFEPVPFEIDKDKASHNIEYTVQDSGDSKVYIQLPIQEMSVNVRNSGGEQEIKYTTAQEIYRVGEPDSDGLLKVELSAEHKIPSREVFLFKQREEVVSDYVQQIRERQNCEITELSSSHLRMALNDPAETVYTTTIPYDSAWKVTVDGKKISTQENAGCFLAFTVPEGSHSVDLVYHPKGFRAGAMISAAALLLLILSELPVFRSKRKYAKTKTLRENS